MAEYDHITTWIFDLDHTLYPAETQMMERIFASFFDYISLTNHISVEEAKARCDVYEEQYGDIFLGWEKHGYFREDEYIELLNAIDISHIPVCGITRDCIARLPGQRIVFTNGYQQHADRLLAHLDMVGLFDHVSTVCKRQHRVKRHPAAYDEVVAALGLAPEECVMVDDHHHNLKPAHELGMTTVLIRKRPIEVDYVHHRADTLRDWLEEVVADLEKPDGKTG